MIIINKGIKPQILTNKSDEWTTELLEYKKNGGKVPTAVSNRYNHQQVKDSLKDEAHSKCMYCESKVGHVSYEHIEHIKPKSKYPEFTYEWDNLGLACPVCNMKKSDNYDPDLLILNPYIEDPSNFLCAMGPYILGMPGEDRGFLTVTQLDLNRVGLIEQRLERIQAIMQLIDNYKKTTNKTLQKMVYNEIVKELQDDKAYSFVLKSTVKIIGLAAA